MGGEIADEKMRGGEWELNGCWVDLNKEYVTATCSTRVPWRPRANHGIRCTRLD